MNNNFLQPVDNSQNHPQQVNSRNPQFMQQAKDSMVSNFGLLNDFL